MPEKELDIYHVDAFTDRVFGGNPAAVVLLREWLPDEVLQAVSAENNLSETAFVKLAADPFGLRWFTPSTEIDLCGHATLAAAHVLFNHVQVPGRELRFTTLGGILRVSRSGELLAMDFPAMPAKPVESPAGLSAALGSDPVEVLQARDLLAVYPSEEDILSLAPDFRALEKINAPGIIVTAPGRDCHFVSRFFAPRIGIPEDPVTGSAHCTLVPYWAGILHRKEFSARQLSKRGGEVLCELKGDRVLISGRAVDYLQGRIRI
ncbi:MAG: PhzF family phenazine biosynthesis protein [Proteobacteria bacterium]|nr:PhzF family phenazine biosynthesis protein [Pseudomonadota bacterium]